MSKAAHSSPSTGSGPLAHSELAATRQGFGDGLYELMQEDDRVVALTADLAESLRMLQIRDEMPQRFFDTGVAEANMAGVAAGVALAGYVPIAGTFAVFLTRAFDHIRVQVCQNNVHAVLVGSHGGVSNALDGGSANALEDLAYMRALPNMTVLFPADYNETKMALQAAVAHDGPIYLRAYREPTPPLPWREEAGQAPEFTIGEARVWREGSDVTIVACGPQVVFSLEAAEKLKADGVSAEVVGVHTLQPLDAETIITSAAKTGRVVTVEDHSVNGGLGSAVAEVLSEQQPTRLKRLGVRQFGESGDYWELIAKLGIDTDGIVAATKELLS